jgi:hypothetical protein
MTEIKNIVVKKNAYQGKQHVYSMGLYAWIINLFNPNQLLNFTVINVHT